MTIVVMSKKRVIEVLKKERLTHSVFAADPDGLQASDTPANARGCTFCAVGQVVRAAMAGNTPLRTVFDKAVDLKFGDRRIRALESAFEYGDSDDGHGDDADGERGRRAALRWTRKHLPKEVRIDIGDAKPRRGMRVVKP